jgi:hypothetical protein
MKPRGIAICWLLWAQGSAHAETAAEPIRIEYEAVAGCPSQQEFEFQVLRRATKARLANAAEPARVFRVELKLEQGRVAGSLVIQEPDGATIARRVSGQQCNDVAVVLALASALAIDPRAELAPQQGVDFAPQAETAAPGPAELPPSVPPSENGAAVAAREKPAFALSLGPRAIVGSAPGTSIGASVAFWARPAERASFGLELAVAQTTSERLLGAVAEVRFLVARPRVCPHSFTLGASLELSPCLVLESGVVQGQSSNIAEPSESARFWLLFELPLRLDVPISESWFIALEAGPGFPVTRYRLVFETPETEVHQIWAVTGAAALHAAVRF